LRSQEWQAALPALEVKAGQAAQIRHVLRPISRGYWWPLLDSERRKEGDSGNLKTHEESDLVRAVRRIKLRWHLQEERQTG
jgi:hypothetical protein